MSINSKKQEKPSFGTTVTITHVSKDRTFSLTLKEAEVNVSVACPPLGLGVINPETYKTAISPVLNFNGKAKGFEYSMLLPKDKKKRARKKK